MTDNLEKYREKRRPSMIFYCSSGAWGGLEANTVQLSLWLRSRGWNIAWIVVQNTPLAKQIHRNNFPVATLLRRPKKYAAFLSSTKIASHLTNHCFFWVFDNWDIGVAGLAKRYSRKKDIRIVYQQHMGIGVNKKSWLHTRRFSNIDCWISPLNMLAEEVGNRTRYPKEKIHVAPLGFDAGRLFSGDCTREESRKILHLPPNNFIVGIIGRLDPAKGQEIVIEAAAKAQKEGQSFSVLIMGDATEGIGDYGALLRDKAKDLGVDAIVTFANYRDNVALFFRAVDIFCLASETETYGMVTLEAMAFGTPIIATDRGGTPELLGDGKFGLLMPPNNPDAIVSAVKEIAQNKLAAELRAENAKQNVFATRTHEIECNILENILENL